LTDTIAFSDLTGVAVDGQIPASIARIDDVITRIAQHAAAADPHPQYLTPAEGAALFAPAGVPTATNLSIINRTATTIDIASDTGQDATIPGASTTLSGVMSAADKAKLDGITAGAQPNAVISVAGKTGVVTLVKGDVGLSVVDNTADADKPISTATATALAARELTAARTLTPTATDPGNTATINGFLSWLISAMRGAQTTLGGLGALATKSTIADIDVAAGAAIAWSKISKSGATPADVGAATAAQGALAATALQPASNLDATRLTGTVPIGSIPAAVATDAEVSAAIAGVTTTSIGADIAGAKTLTPTAIDPGNTATNSGFLSWLISAMRGAQTTLGGLGALANKSTIADIDVAAGAAIAWSKISKSGATAADVGAATAAQGALAATALQPASNLDATRLTGTVPIGSIPAAVATDAEVATAIAGVTTTSIGADIAGSKTLTPTAIDPGNTATNSGFLSWLISAVRSIQTTLSGLGTLATKSTIVSADITDGTITNADISATAAIVASKLSGVQPLSSRLTGFDELAGPGLVQLPSGAGTSPTIVPVGAGGLAAIAGADASGVRAEIDAEVSSTPGATLRTTLTGSGLERRASDGSVWMNGKIRQAPATIAQRALSQRGLVPNGTCEIPAVADASGILRAEGWGDFLVDTSNKLAGGYTIRRLSPGAIISSDQFFSLTPGAVYGLFASSFAGSSPPVGAGYTLALSMWDGEATPQPVDLPTYNYLAGSASTLSRPLNVGDTSIFINKAGVTSSTYLGAFRHFAIYGSAGYVSPSGTQYRAPQSGSSLGFYTQWHTRISSGTSATITDLGTELRIDVVPGLPWAVANPAGGAWPIGTLCGATGGGDGNFYYPAGTSRAFIPDNYDIIRPSRSPETVTATFKFAIFGTVPTTLADNLPPGCTALKVATFQSSAADWRFNANIFEI
jgi:hypothetical protein